MNDFCTPPPAVPDAHVAFPVPHVLLLTLDRPARLNALPTTHHAPLATLFRWFDGEPRLRVAVVTGAGRAFCAGADLKEWNDSHAAAQPRRRDEKWGSFGFGGLSNRTGKKPVIAAVNGLCLGGGMEMAVNCDLVVAARSAQFGLPEVKRGVVAIAGALPRIAQTLGRQRAAEMALTGRTFAAAELQQWGIVNRVVDGDVVAAALKLAADIAANSPDAVVVSRVGLRLGADGVPPERATEMLDRGVYAAIDGGANMTEGVRSFVEKRAPVWVDSKL